jgi:hypothetical protein
MFDPVLLSVLAVTMVVGVGGAWFVTRRIARRSDMPRVSNWLAFLGGASFWLLSLRFVGYTDYLGATWRSSFGSIGVTVGAMLAIAVLFIAFILIGSVTGSLLGWGLVAGLKLFSRVVEPSPIPRSSEETFIEFSRTKLIGLSIIAGAFVAGGAQMLFGKSGYSFRVFWFFNDPAFVHGAGLLGILFFGLGELVILKKLFENKPGLVLNATGLLDNSAGLSIGFLAWSDVAGFEAKEFLGQRLLVVRLEDPTHYLETCSPLMRVQGRINVRLIGSPVAISSNALRIDFSELVSVCNSWLAKYQRGRS